MLIEYRTIDNKQIAEEEISKFDTYREVHIDPDTELIKMVYQFYNNNLQCVEYYLDPEEDEAEKISDFKEICPLFSLVERQSINGNRIEVVNDYGSGILRFKTRYLYDSRGNAICLEEIDLNTNLPNYKKTKKYLFNNDGEEILEAEYNSDASLNVITYMAHGTFTDQQDWDYFEASDFSKLQSKLRENLNYYFTAILEPDK